MADPAVAREGQQKQTASRRYTTSSEFVCQCRKSRAFDGHGLAKGVHLKETVVIDNLAQFRCRPSKEAALVHARFLISDESGCGPIVDRRGEPFDRARVKQRPLSEQHDPIRSGRKRYTL